MMEFIGELLFSNTAKNILLSAITAILFAGGTNFILQKINRKGNLLSEKGFLIISTIKEFDRNRNKLMSSLATRTIDKNSLREIRLTYSKVYYEFKNFLDIYSFLLNRKSKRELKNYLEYAQQPLDSLDKLLDDKSATFNFSKKFENNFSSEIIKLIQKQMI